MRVANDVEVRVQVFCRNFLVLLLLECTLFVVVIMMLVECFTSLSPATDLVIKLKCTPSYDGRLPEHWQYDIYYGQSLKINIAGGSPSFVPIRRR